MNSFQFLALHPRSRQIGEKKVLVKFQTSGCTKFTIEGQYIDNRKAFLGKALNRSRNHEAFTAQDD